MRLCNSYQAANITGILYTVIVTASIIATVLLYSCPATCDRDVCEIVNYFGVFIMLELAINLILFVFYSRLDDLFSFIHFLFIHIIVLSRKLRKTIARICQNYEVIARKIWYFRKNDPQNWMNKVTFVVKFDDSGRKYCMECNRMAPKRSHHCLLCNMCVLRKDHHCFMTGACVGIANQVKSFFFFKL